jgi:hypothetical protein
VNMSNATVQLKLIGAETYACRPAGIEFPVHAGDIVDVFAEKAGHLLDQVYRVGRNEYPVWTKDLRAEINTANSVLVPLEARKRLKAEEDERNAAFDAERVAKEESLEREAELKRRVERLEALLLKDEEVATPSNDEELVDAPDDSEVEVPEVVAKAKKTSAKKKVTRKRAATKAA